MDALEAELDGLMPAETRLTIEQRGRFGQIYQAQEGLLARQGSRPRTLGGVPGPAGGQAAQATTTSSSVSWRRADGLDPGDGPAAGQGSAPAWEARIYLGWRAPGVTLRSLEETEENEGEDPVQQAGRRAPALEPASMLREARHRRRHDEGDRQGRPHGRRQPLPPLCQQGDLAWALYERHLERFVAALDESARTAGGARSRLDVLLRRFRLLFEEEPDVYTYIVLAQHHLLKRIPSTVRTPTDVVAEVLAEGQRKGEVRKGSAPLFAVLIVGMVIRVTLLKLHGWLKDDLDHLEREVEEACWRVVAR